MTLIPDRDQQALDENTLTDRRRPGRATEVNPALIPLLRTSELPSSLDEDLALEEEDQISGLRGIASGVALSIPIWVGIAYVGRWLLT